MQKVFFSGLLLLSMLPVRADRQDSLFMGLFRRDIGGWIAADATYSISLPDGRTLWLFGDTFIGEVDANNAIVPGASFIRNSAVLQDGDSMQTLFNGTRENPDDFILTSHPDSLWYWPEHGIVDSDTLRIFLAKFRHSDTGNDGFDFEHAGNDIASFSWPGLEFLHTREIGANKENGVYYGDRILEESDWLYIYGRRDDEPGSNIPYPHVARCRVGELAARDWEFYDGSGWSPEAVTSSRIHDFPVSQQYSVSTYMGKYILLTQEIWLGSDIWSFTSDTPVGPWEQQTLLYTTPETKEGLMTYNAWAHPQFDHDGQILISYNTNGDFASIFENVEVYRPRFIRVPYMNMDWDFWPPTSMEDHEGKTHGFSIYPNPAVDYFRLDFELEVPGDISVEVLDMQGGSVRQLPSGALPAGSHSLTVSLEGLEGGIYLLRLSWPGGMRIFKLIKENQ